MGPDGAVYIADLYQQIIQHNQIDFRDPRRDHSRGRIWRIVRKDRPLLPWPKLVGAPVTQVLDALKAPELWTRQQAKRALAERGRKEVAGELAAWVKKLDAADPDLQRHLLEALWTSQGIDEVDAELLARVLRSDEPRARAAATRVLGAWSDRLPDAARLLAAQAADPHPRVRLEAVLAAGRIPSAAATEAALRALDQPSDPLLDFALRRTVALLKPHWYPEFQAGRLTFGGRARPLAFALQAARAPDAVPALAAMVKEGKVPREGRADVLALLAALGDAPQQALVLEEALAEDRLTPAERVRVLEALAQSARERPVRPAGDAARIASLFGHKDAALGAAALRLAGAWKLEKLRDEVARAAGDADAPASRRRAAVAALIDLSGRDSQQCLADLAASKLPYGVRADAAAGLAALDVKGAAALAADLLRRPVTAADDPSDLFTAFLQRAGGQAALASALGSTKPSPDAARVGLRVVNSLGVPAPELLAVLQGAAGQGGQARKLDAKGLRRLIELTQKEGDPARGEAVFRRPLLGCVQCHAIAGAGSRVGPDLATVGTSAPLDYLVESILLPAKVVKEGYTTAQVVTKDGKALSGILLRESPRELVLRDPTRDELTIPMSEVEEKHVGGSLMPAALDQTLTDAELADLVRFLSELGRPGPYALSHVPVARRWMHLPAVPASLAALDDATLGKALRDDARLTWAPAYSLVSGDLPLAEAAAGGKAAVLRTQIDVATPGKVELVFNDAAGLRLWLDGRPVPAAGRVALDLARGPHTLDVLADPAARKGGRLRCELAVPPGSKAQAAFAGGR
jgi:putative heme-binding domain-containing protein